MNIKIYTTTNCHFCKLAKQYFKDKKIDYEEYNVEEDNEKANEMIKISGQRSVPVIDIDGTIIIGYDKEAIDKTLF